MNANSFLQYLLGLSILLSSCQTSDDITPDNTTGGVVVTPPASTVVMVNGYLPDWKPTSFFSSADYSRMTIAYFAFVVCDANGNLVTNGNESKMTTMTAAAHAANTKAYLSFGGGGYYGSSVFFNMAKEEASRTAFAHNVKEFCLDKGFDGFDVDWEGLSSAEEGEAHEALMKTLKDTLHAAGLGLVVTVQQGFNAANFTYEGINQADLVQIMSYDATGTWSGSSAGQHSSYNFAVNGLNYWADRGISKAKLVSGLPFYGYRFATMPCPCSAITYGNIVNNYPSLSDDTDYLESGVYNKTYFNGYNTIMEKVYMANGQGAAGVMIWEISQDATGPKSLLTRMNDNLVANGYTLRKLTASIP